MSTFDVKTALPVDAKMVLLVSSRGNGRYYKDGVLVPIGDPGRFSGASLVLDDTPRAVIRDSGIELVEDVPESLFTCVDGQGNTLARTKLADMEAARQLMKESQDILDETARMTEQAATLRKRAEGIGG